MRHSPSSDAYLLLLSMANFVVPNFCASSYSLVVDTTYATPTEVAEVILSSLEVWRDDKELKLCYLSPERINYIDDEHDTEKMTEYASALERGEEIPPVKVFESDGEFYIEEGQESALAYAFNFSTYLPAVIVKGEIGERKYVKMKNSL